MKMETEVRPAMPGDTHAVSSILFEAAAWLEQRGMGMWRSDELVPEHIARQVGEGLFVLAECHGNPAGILRFQLSDPLFWPDQPESDAAYVHRLAVRRQYAGGDVSSTLLSWAVERTRALGRPFLRLDCEASRPRLRAVYERFGFQHHSDLQVGPYFVARYQLAICPLTPDPLY